MLCVNLEYKKNVLFVRMKGSLNKNTSKRVKRDISDLIFNNKIKNVIFNLKELSYIDSYGIDSISKNYDAALSNDGKLVLCDISNCVVKHRLNNSKIMECLYEANSEIGALNILECEVSNDKL